MKRKVAVLVVIMLLCCIFAVGASAKIISNGDNFTEDTAPKVGFDDTVMVIGKVKEDIYFKFSFKNHGLLTVNSFVEGTELKWRISYPILFYKEGNQKGGQSYVSMFDTKGRYSANNVKSLTVTPGTYYMLVKGYAYNNDRFNSYDSWNLKMEFSFECSHIETEEEVVREATCEREGIVEVICVDCGESVGENKTERLEHNPSKKWVTTKEATCKKAGERVKYCIDCDEEVVVEETEKADHTYENWEDIIQPTCEKTGKRRYTCIVCGEEKTETVETTDHNFQNWKVEQIASPDKKGFYSSTCTYCGEKGTETFEYDFDELKSTPVKKHSFTDVSEKSWYNEVVSKCNHFGLMVGTSDTNFNPAGNITRAEVITAAVRVYCLYNPDVEKPDLEASPWYKGYVDFAVKHGIVEKDDFAHYTLPATRAEMAYVFTNAAGEDNLERINDITSIPDVNMNDKYAEEIFMLYNAGVLTGNDDAGTFSPNKNIVRSEAAAIIARICKISDRVER